MDIQNGLSKEKEYIADKSQIRTSIFTKIIISFGIVIVYFSMSNGINADELETSKVILLIILSIFTFMIIASASNTFKTYRVIISEEDIKFQKLINRSEITKYEWKDVHIVIIGDVEVKNSRLPYTVFGVEIFYKEKYSKKLTSEVYKLNHLANYESLIDDIIEKCDRNNIKCEDSR